MKKLFAVALTLSAMTVPGYTQQLDKDDIKWINECIVDNKNEDGATAKIIRTYCFCMNEKMDSSESKSISTWEKSNPRAKRACEQQSGWR